MVSAAMAETIDGSRLTVVNAPIARSRLGLSNGFVQMLATQAVTVAAGANVTVTTNFNGGTQAVYTVASSGGSGSPAGNAGDIQFNHGGAFAGTNVFGYDRTNRMALVTEPGFGTIWTPQGLFQGSNQPLRFGVWNGIGGGSNWTITTGGHWIPNGSNTYDIGQNDLPVRAGYFGTNYTQNLRFIDLSGSGSGFEIFCDTATGYLTVSNLIRGSTPLVLNTNGSTTASNLFETPFGVAVGVPIRMFVITNDVATVTNTTGETTLLTGSSKGTFTIPANFLVNGMTLQIHLSGKFTTPAGPGVHTLSIKLGSTVIATNLSTFNASLVNEAWHLDATITCRLTGASGSVKCQGSFHSPTAAGGAIGGYRHIKMGTTYDAVTVDTTASQAIDVTIAPGATTTGITTCNGYALIVP